MREVGAFEAKTKLSELLDAVMAGEEIIITRHGKEAARLVPPKNVYDREKARDAVQRIEEMRSKQNFGKFDWAEWKQYVNEGRP